MEYGAEITATGATGTIRFAGIPDTADLTRVAPTTLTLGEGTTEVLPSASAPQNFAEGAEYTVKGEGLADQNLQRRDQQQGRRRRRRR